MAKPITDRQRLTDVLRGVSFPARSWQLVAQADSYGVDCHTRAVLDRLPLGVYHSIDAILAMINRDPPGGNTETAQGAPRPPAQAAHCGVGL